MEKITVDYKVLKALVDAHEENADCQTCFLHPYCEEWKSCKKNIWEALEEGLEDE